MATIGEKVRKHRDYVGTWGGVYIPLRALVYSSRVPGISRKGQPIGSYEDEVRDRITLLKKVLYDVHPGETLPTQIAAFINTGLRASYRFTLGDSTNFDDRLAYVATLANDYRAAWPGSWRYDRDLSLRQWKKRILVHLERIKPEGRGSHNLKQLFAALNMALSWLVTHQYYVKPISSPSVVVAPAEPSKTDRLAETLRRDLEIKVAEKLGAVPLGEGLKDEDTVLTCQGWCSPKRKAILWFTPKNPVTGKFSIFASRYCEECFDRATESRKDFVWDWLFNRAKFYADIELLNKRIGEQAQIQPPPTTTPGKYPCDVLTCKAQATAAIHNRRDQSASHHYSCWVHTKNFMWSNAAVTIEPL